MKQDKATRFWKTCSLIVIVFNAEFTKIDTLRNGEIEEKLIFVCGLIGHSIKLASANYFSVLKRSVINDGVLEHTGLRKAFDFGENPSIIKLNYVVFLHPKAQEKTLHLKRTWGRLLQPEGMMRLHHHIQQFPPSMEMYSHVSSLYLVKQKTINNQLEVDSLGIN